MNWLTKFSKKAFIYILIPAIFGGTVFAETITGGIRKEYKSKETQKAEIPYNEPEYSLAAVLAYNKALEEYKLSNYDEAIENFKLAIKQEPLFADAYFNLGILYEYFANTNNALVSFSRAYSINKKDDEALYYLIKSYLQIGDQVAANYYLKKMPTDSKYYKITQELFY